MNQRNLYILIITFIVSIGIILILYAFTQQENSNIDSSFTRKFIDYPIAESRALDIKYNSYYIAGATAENIYLGNITTPFHVLIINKSLKSDSIQRKKITLTSSKDFKFKSVYITIDSPDFYLTDGTMPIIIQGTIDNFEAKKYIQDSVYFTSYLPIDSTTSIFRSVNKNGDKNILIRKTISPPSIKLESSILEKQIDGIFCTDGMLQYASDQKKVVYTYYYRNQFICMDQNLRVMYKGKTIDSVSRAKIKVKKISSSNATTLSAPILIVNKKSSVSGDYLFINSGIIGMNEDKRIFNEASVIDMYDLKTGAYKFSFYLFNHDKKKLQSFKVFQNKIIAIYDHYLVTYDLKASLLH